MIKPYNKSILDIAPYVPGSVAKSSKRLIKLSSNENPFGCSEKVKSVIANSCDKLHRYPDGSSFELRSKLAEKNNINPDRIVCGAGSDEIITLICMAFAGQGAEVMYTKHGFLMYPISAKACGAKPIAIDEKNLRADIDAMIDAVNEKTKIIFIANPNNPTGSYISHLEAEKLLSSVPKDVIVVLDLAYAEYAKDIADYPDIFSLIEKYPNLIMTRTFSKAYGIPALRLGWSYSSAEIADYLNRVRGPFNTTSISQIAAIAALDDDDFIEQSVEHNNLWLKKFASEFKELGLVSYPSIANFVLVDFNSHEKAVAVDEFLRNEGVSGRRMEAYKLDSCIRFSIGLESENETLLSLLNKFFKDN